MHNGAVRRSVAAPPGAIFFFDTSFSTPGASLRNMRFGPLSPNNWAAIGGVNVTTPQMALEAATESWTFADAAGYGINPGA